MKRKYLLMVSSLSNMGGAQMYIRNKMLYLRNHGWEVNIITAKAQNVVISELKEFKNIFPELQYCRFYYRNKIQKDILEKLKSIVIDCDYDEIIIESTSIEQSTWAESLSQLVKAKHLIFLLQEHNEIKNQGLRKYFIFKYKRHELVGINPKSLQIMFRDFYPLNDDESYHLPAYCNNVEADVDCSIIQKIDYEQYDYIVGGFSRLNKSFVLQALNDFCNYAAMQADKRFLLLWIGDAPEGSALPSVIKELVNRLPNVTLLITGYLYPVPTKLLELCDIFISSAGSSRVCARSGVPTITYDGNDFKPIGILGHTTKNSLFRDQNEFPQKLEVLMHQVLVDKIYPKLLADYKSGLPDFSDHMKFINQIIMPLDYFNMNILHAESWTERKVSLGLSVFGANGYTRFHEIKIGIKSRI